MHQGTCVTHVSWCMSGSLTRGGREKVPGIPRVCATGHFTHLIRCPCPQEIRYLMGITIKARRVKDQAVAHLHVYAKTVPILIMLMADVRSRLMSFHVDRSRLCSSVSDMLKRHWTMISIFGSLYFLYAGWEHDSVTTYSWLKFKKYTLKNYLDA